MIREGIFYHDTAECPAQQHLGVSECYFYIMNYITIRKLRDLLPLWAGVPFQAKNPSNRTSTHMTQGNQAASIQGSCSSTTCTHNERISKVWKYKAKHNWHWYLQGQSLTAAPLTSLLSCDTRSLIPALKDCMLLWGSNIKLTSGEISAERYWGIMWLLHLKSWKEMENHTFPTMSVQIQNNHSVLCY